jgi:hypothetical protein
MVQNPSGGVLNLLLFFEKPKKRINKINGFRRKWGVVFLKRRTKLTAHPTGLNHEQRMFKVEALPDESGGFKCL